MVAGNRNSLRQIRRYSAICRSLPISVFPKENRGSILCCQFLLIKCAIYINSRVDLGDLLLLLVSGGGAIAVAIVVIRERERIILLAQ